MALQSVHVIHPLSRNSLIGIVKKLFNGKKTGRNPRKSGRGGSPLRMAGVHSTPCVQNDQRKTFTTRPIQLWAIDNNRDAPVKPFGYRVLIRYQSRYCKLPSTVWKTLGCLFYSHISLDLLSFLLTLQDKVLQIITLI